VDTVASMHGYKRSPSGQTLTVDLNRDRYRELVAARGWSTQVEQAAALGISQPTITRIVESAGRPGPRVIAALLATFPEEHFRSLFDIVPAEDFSSQRVAA
jgi:hypothetical protein